MPGEHKEGGRCVESKVTEQTPCRFSTGFPDAYEMGPYLGSGSFGTVHVAIKKATGERYSSFSAILQLHSTSTVMLL
jgi:hypothetical protein